MDAISLAEKADELYQNGKFDEALPFYDKAIETYSKDKTLWNRRGLALCRLGRYDPHPAGRPFFMKHFYADMIQ